MTAKVPRRLVRLDEDIFQRLRPVAYHQETDVTKLVNYLLRRAIPAADAGLLANVEPLAPTEEET